MKLGLAQVPEGRKLFPHMSVLANIKLGAYLRKDDASSDLERVFTLFPASRRERTSGPEASPAESSRCSLSPVPSWRSPVSS